MLRSGIPTISEYQQLLQHDLFTSMQGYSNAFLRANRDHLMEYATKWVVDPLHQWSRQWEYPFVFERVRSFLPDGTGTNCKILDGGSGVTFFPYYLAREFACSVHCCDCDDAHGHIFDAINRDSPVTVRFKSARLQDTGYDPDFFDVVYCISVLEHTDDYASIIREFHRIVRPGGRLVVTFDVSLDGRMEIDRDRAAVLLAALESCFEADDRPTADLRSQLGDATILTTRYAYRLDPQLLWQRPPFWRRCLQSLKAGLLGKGTVTFPPLSTVYCLSLEKRGT